MPILLRLVVKNLLEKKFRLLLLIFSLAMSSTLFFVANGAATTVKSISRDVKRKYVGSADIVVEPNTRTSPFLPMELAQKHADSYEYLIGTVEGSAVYRTPDGEKVQVRLRGIDLDDLQKLSTVRLVAEENLLPFAGRKLIVGKPAADRYNLKVGESIDLEVNGRQERFTVSGIAEGMGIFLDDGEAVFMAVPRQTLAGVYEAGHDVNALYIKLKDPAGTARMINVLSEDYPKFTVREAISQAELERDARERTDPYKLIVVVLLFMSVFVIYSSFRVIAVERLPIVGALRSVGATKLQAGAILLGESLVCGVAGGLVGCLLGIGLLHVMLLVALPSNLRNMEVSVHFTFGQLVATFVLAVGVALVSALIPVVQTARLPIKTTLFGLEEHATRHKAWKLFLGFGFLAVAMVAPRVAPTGMAIPVSLLSVVLPLAAMLLLVPSATRLLVRLLERIYQNLFGNIGALAAKNLRENTSIQNNIVLLIISISTFLVINTLSQSVAAEMKDLFRNNALFDVVVWAKGDDRQMDRLIYQTPGVTGVLMTPAAFGIEVVGTGTGFAKIYGAPKVGFLEYWDIKLLGSRPPAEVMDELDAGRNILVTSLMRDKLGLSVGDVIKLRMPRGDVPYRVIGFFQSYNSGGSFAIISDRFLRLDMKDEFWSQFGVKVAGDSAEVAASLKRDLKDRSWFIRTVNEDEQINYEQFKTLFDMLKGFSVLVLIISLLGVVNNFVINFLQRKRSLAVLRSIGMSRRQIVSMILAESFTGGLLGAVLGCVGGLLMISVMPFFMVAIEQVAPIHLSAGVLIACLATGVGVSLIASTSPALRSSRLNIVRAIKYE